MRRHSLDINPIPKEKSPLYVNEPWILDSSIEEDTSNAKNPESVDDNIRIYVPMDINRQAIIRRDTRWM